MQTTESGGDGAGLPRMSAKVSADGELWARLMAELPVRHLLDPVQWLDSVSGELYFPHEPETEQPV